ncbi:MAG: ABC transporter permease [Rhizobiales bacterium]|nr:ABC transporter permease [Hyphomicrobiales bacterium]
MSLALRLAGRELRGGLRGFIVFLACLSLGVGAIAGVGSVSRALLDGLGQQGQVILGGDMSLSLIHRTVNEAERRWLEDAGDISEIATLRAMVRMGDDQALAEIKAVDRAYPLYGAVTLAQGGALEDAIAVKNGVFGIVVEDTLLGRLDLETGDIVRIGDADFEIRDQISSEPDKLSSGLIFGPRVMMSVAGLDATGLVRPGSLVHWFYRIRLAGDGLQPGRLESFEQAVTTALPDAGWQIRNRTNASPRVSTAIERFTHILTLVGLTALIVGGVGVANAVHAHLNGKRKVIATLKCLGAPGRQIFLIYFFQIMMLAAAGTVIGLALGMVIQFVAASALDGVLPFAGRILPYPEPLMLAALYGMLVAMAFSLWPLGRAQDVSVASLIRDQVEDIRRWPRVGYILAAITMIGIIAALAVFTSSNSKIALTFVVASGVVLFVLRLVAMAIMAIARRLPSFKSPEMRLAVANIHRPGSLTGTVVLSLGLGLTLLVSLALIDGNLTRQLTGQIPDKAPNFFFVDVQRSEAAQFGELISEIAPGADYRTVPMLRGRILSLNNVATADINAPPDKRWALSGDRGLTYSSTLPESSELAAGEWWDEDYSGPPLVSFESELAEAFDLSIGDPIVVNVMGREITAKIANLRAVRWGSLTINFVMVFSPNTFAGAPHMNLATLELEEDGADITNREIEIMRDVGAAFPHVTVIRVKEAMEAANALLSQIMWAIRAVSSVTLIASILVLGGALAAGHRHRLYDAVILKTFGATRNRLLLAFGLEFLILGLITAILALIGGSIAAEFVLTQLMDGDYEFIPLVAGMAVVGAVGFTVILGLIGTWRILGEKPARVLRDL